jgi:hypothetical protein
MGAEAAQPLGIGHLDDASGRSSGVLVMALHAAIRIASGSVDRWTNGTIAATTPAAPCCDGRLLAARVNSAHGAAEDTPASSALAAEMRAAAPSLASPRRYAVLAADSFQARLISSMRRATLKDFVAPPSNVFAIAAYHAAQRDGATRHRQQSSRHGRDLIVGGGIEHLSTSRPITSPAAVISIHECSPVEPQPCLYRC